MLSIYSTFTSNAVRFSRVGVCLPRLPGSCKVLKMGDSSAPGQREWQEGRLLETMAMEKGKSWRVRRLTRVWSMTWSSWSCLLLHWREAHSVYLGARK